MPLLYNDCTRLIINRQREVGGASGVSRITLKFSDRRGSARPPEADDVVKSVTQLKRKAPVRCSALLGG